METGTTRRDLARPVGSFLAAEAAAAAFHPNTLDTETSSLLQIASTIKRFIITLHTCISPVLYAPNQQ